MAAEQGRGGPIGREIPDADYSTQHFERVVALNHLTDFMKRSDPFGKTIVFFLDQEHADGSHY